MYKNVKNIPEYKCIMNTTFLGKIVIPTNKRYNTQKFFSIDKTITFFHISSRISLAVRITTSYIIERVEPTNRRFSPAPLQKGTTPRISFPPWARTTPGWCVLISCPSCRCCRLLSRAQPRSPCQSWSRRRSCAFSSTLSAKWKKKAYLFCDWLFQIKRSNWPCCRSNWSC